ncbi:carboxylesterase [Cyanophage S-SSM6a]|uniref:Carboxylesterase n=1 Tax=Synechococcus phage S-SSM7 TaxID=445686 RepID=E3SLI9_9CAUD|nr:esterase [Synechococcus phage S-SSM7]ADO98337.1 carboxylesterase [Synechococcus phage S-SSM7]AGH07584.1 carboxylesterase [Cyanophage S-SSM6a]
MISDAMTKSYHDVMKAYKKEYLLPLRYVPVVFWALVTFLTVSIAFPIATHAEVLWVQVPQWEDDWSKCAVDVPDTSCHWYVANADNTFGKGFDWETAPWFSAEGLLDVKSNVVEGLQKVG